MKNRKVYDHNGKEYNSIKEMCEEYGINPHTFISRLNSGHSISDSLLSSKIIDPWGNKFTSIKEMCAFHNISYKNYNSRIKRGWKMEDALKKEERVKDHLGQGFSSILEMCDFYNIKADTYRCRIRRGWSIKEALQGQKATNTPITKKKDNTVPIYDHLNNTYESLKGLCKKYNITQAHYLAGISKGWDIEKILTILPARTIYKNFYILQVNEQEGLVIYKVKNLNTKDILMMTRDMMDNYKDE